MARRWSAALRGAATALGTVILDEWPSTEEVVGGIIILLGVLVATVRKGTAE